MSELLESHPNRIKSATTTLTHHGLLLGAIVLGALAINGTLGTSAPAAAAGVQNDSSQTVQVQEAQSQEAQPQEALQTTSASVGPGAIDFGPDSISSRSQATIAQLDFAWREILPDWSIVFVPGDSDVAGYTWSQEQRIEIFVRPDSTPEFLHRVLAHELGHAFDVEHNDGERRREWLSLRGAATTPWWPQSGSADFETGAGDFAEVFAVWITGDAQDFRSEVGPEPDDATLWALEQLIQGAS